MARVRIRVPDCGTATTWRCSARPASASAGCSNSLDEVGAETLERYRARWFDYSEQRMIAAIRRLPAGHRRARRAPRPDPGHAGRRPGQGRP